MFTAIEKNALYNYTWSASASHPDSPKIYDQYNFVWMAPIVDTPTEVTITLFVSTSANITGGPCVSEAIIKLLVESSSSITVVKNAIPNDSQAFQFTGSPVIGDFSLYDDGSSGPDPTHNNKTFGELQPGNYSIEEIVPPGWDLTSAVCSDGSPVNAIDLGPGENVTVTFTNTKRGRIIVDKVTSPTADPQEFEFQTNYGNSFNLSDASTPNDSGPLSPGTYSVIEIPVPCWDTQITSDDGSDPSAIQLGPGETIHVTATNTKSAPVVTIAPPAVLTCTLTSVTLNATVTPEGSYTYSWKNSDNKEIATTKDTTVGSPGTYTLNVTSESGCTVKETVTVTQDTSVPTVTIAFPEVLTCTVKSVKLDANVTPAGTYTYSWKDARNNVISTSEDPVISEPGTYTLNVTGTSDCTVTESVTVSYKECEPAVGSISGTKFEDINGNSEWDSNEPGLGEWIINLKSQDGEVVKIAITSASTATLGSYSINNISPGNYTLEEVPSFSANWTQTYPAGNIYTVVVSETGVVTVTKSDQTDVPSTNADFGNKFTQSGELEITKTTSVETLTSNTEATFTITVQNTGNIEVHDLKIIDELSPMLEFIPYAHYGDILISHTIVGSKLIFDLAPLGSLQPGNSWTITYNVKLGPEACTTVPRSTVSPPATSDEETELNVMAAGSESTRILQIIDSLSRNKTKLEAKLESIKKQQGTFDKGNASIESITTSIAGTNYTRNNYTNISTGETLNEQLDATGFLVLSEYTRSFKYDILTTTYGIKGEVLSDIYTFLPTNETLLIEYDKPGKGYRTYTIRYYATGDTLIITVDSHGSVVSREYRTTPGIAVPEYLTNCATAYGNAGEQNGPVESNRDCVDVRWRCDSAQGSISGTKFEDKNGNNEWDTNEPGLGDWMINLKGPDGEIVKVAITSDSPEALGSYSINSISPGTYTLEEVLSLSPGWTQTCPAGNIYTVVVSETGQVTVTRSDQTIVASTQLNFGNMFTHYGKLEITKATLTEILNQNGEATFIIEVLNTGDTEIHNIQIVDELSPMLEFIPYAYYGDTLIHHTFNGGNLIFDLSPLGSLEPGDSWTITYNVKLSPDACDAVSTSTILPTIASADETKLKVMDTGSSPANLLQTIDALSRNKTKLQAKLESIKKKQETFDKAGVAVESGIRSIAGTNYTLINYTNISTGETLNEQRNATGFLVLSEYTRPARFDQLTTTYDTKGELISEFYTFLPTKETIKIEYNKPEKGYRTYTIRYYATGDTLIMKIDSYGIVVFREYRRTPGLAEPDYLTNCATAYGKTGGQEGIVGSNRACVNLGWSCQTPQPLLRFRVFKEADREIAKPGDIIKYNYTVVNTGTIVLTSLTLNDDKLGIIVLNDPDPLEPGESRTYYANYIVKAGDGPKLENIVVATALDPDGNEVTAKATESVEIIITNTICLTKTASPKVARPGDYVTYNITWYVSGDTIVDDYPSGVSFVSASPTPIDDGNNNKWKIDGRINGTITILVQVTQDIGNTSFDMDQGVTGTGFVNVHNDIRTNPVILKNKATLYEKDIPKCTAYADVNVGPPQTYVALKEHGSGNYASEDVIRYQNSNRSIQLTKGLTATHKPTTFSLPNNRNVDFRSKWSEKAESKNYATGGSTNEEYTYASRINQSSSLKLDENGSTMKSETDFEGVGHIGLVKKDAGENRTWNASQIFESQEDYVGSFKINQKFDEYGKNVEYEKSVNGTGYVSASRDLGKAQSSYESGTGNYQSDEKISTVVNYIAKDMNLTHQPTSYNYTPTFSTSSDIKWSEGLWSKTPTSLISGQFSLATNLILHSIARGLNEMVTEADVTGQADFRTVYRDNSPNSTDEVDQEETYVGEFEINRKASLGGVAKYDRPHLSLSKIAKVDLLNTTYANYQIIIENNGNRALGPVYVKDILPAGTEYISSSLRPAELTTMYANWSLPAMGIGSKVIINLQLNITQEPSNLVNQVEAAGKYDGGWTLARNFSAVRLNWLTCCPPQISASKTARIDALDPKIVWYSLFLKNREKYTMVAFLIDQLPPTMKLLNSSEEPSETRSNQITWNILDLAPGENRTIVYRAMAESDGVYVNVAHIEAFSVDGPDYAMADVEARIALGVGGALSSSQSSDWQPPTCFGLNCSGRIPDGDWVPCDTCTAGEPGNAMVLPPCASCMDTGDDSLP
jgi:uncharacterized repeat protein (TIGR01451 family)